MKQAAVLPLNPVYSANPKGATRPNSDPTKILPHLFASRDHSPDYIPRLEPFDPPALLIRLVSVGFFKPTPLGMG